MEKKIAVWHHGKLAHYSVRKEENGHFVARLLSYSGSVRDEPPAKIELHKEGRHWEDEGADQDLVDDIGHAIEHNKEAIQKPVYHQKDNNKRNNNNNNKDRSDRKLGGKP